MKSDYFLSDVTSAGAEEYKFENEKNLGVWSLKEVSFPDLSIPLVATSVTPLNLRPYCLRNAVALWVM